MTSEWFNRDQVDAMEESERAQAAATKDDAVDPVLSARGTDPRPRATESDVLAALEADCVTLRAKNERLEAQVRGLRLGAEVSEHYHQLVQDEFDLPDPSTNAIVDGGHHGLRTWAATIKESRPYDWECDTCHVNWKGDPKPCPKCGGKNFIHRYGSNVYELRDPASALAASSPGRWEETGGGNHMRFLIYTTKDREPFEARLLRTEGDRLVWVGPNGELHWRGHEEISGFEAFIGDVQVSQLTPIVAPLPASPREQP